MPFSTTADGRKFAAETADGTAAAVREAIARAANDLGEAGAILRTGRLPGCGMRESHDRLYELVYRNEPARPSDLRWYGDADWAVRAAGRLQENRAAGYVVTGHRRGILNGEELTLFAAGDDRIVEQPNPVAGRSGRIWTYVSAEQVALALRGTAAAQALAREIILVRLEADSIGGSAQMVRKARDWLIDHDPDPAGHVVVALADSDGVRTVTMQRFDADGQPATTTDHPVCLEDNFLLRKTSWHDAGPTNDELLNRSGQQVLIGPLDHRFQGHVVVGEAEFEWLSGAYGYGAASTVPGVITALKTFKARIRRGETISLFEPGTMYQLEASRLSPFEDWVHRHFPGIGAI